MRTKRLRAKAARGKAGTQKAAKRLIYTQLEQRLAEQLVELKRKHREQQEIALATILALLASKKEVVDQLDTLNGAFFRLAEQRLSEFTQLRVADKALASYVLSMADHKSELRAILDRARDYLAGDWYLKRADWERLKEVVG
jgi:hypothetical protein